VSNPLQSLKRLEELVKQASEALDRTSAENRALKEKLKRLETDQKRIREELKTANMTLARHARLRARLLKLSEKLERAA